MLRTGSAKGMARPSAWPWRLAGCRRWPRGRRAACSRSTARVLVGHDGEVELDRRRPRRAAPTASVTRRWISLRSGQPATVSATCTRHRRSPSMRTSRTMSRSTMLRCSSGSSTGRSASMTSARGLAWTAPGETCGGGRCRGGACPGQPVGEARRPGGISPTAIGTIPGWIEPATRRPTEFVVDGHRASPRPSATPPGASIYLFAREHPDGRDRGRGRRALRACTPTWPATTSTSWPAAATSRSAVDAGRGRRRRPARPSTTGSPSRRPPSTSPSATTTC